jgi:O-antigen ligase
MLTTLNRHNLPSFILSILPFTLFFPVGIINTGVFLFLISWLLSGEYKEKWKTSRANPIFIPILILSLTSLINAVYFGKQSEEFWSSLGHYQIYLLLLIFASVNDGAWQKTAKYAFYTGALYGSTVYYLNSLELLPTTQPFLSYTYHNGKSIMLCILMALASGWMLNDLLNESQARMRWIRWTRFIFVSIALIFITKSRTAHLLFLLFVLFLLMTKRKLSMKRGAVYLAIFFLSTALILSFSKTIRERVLETVHDTQIHKMGNFTSTGMRLDMYKITLEMISEKPILGHGVGTWLPMFQQRSIGLGVNQSLTPHNEYLLHTSEGGLLALGALLLVWGSQCVIAYKMGGYQAKVLGILNIAMIVGGMFNAVLRDAVYGLPFMILLAIPLVGVSQNKESYNTPLTREM